MPAPNSSTDKRPPFNTLQGWINLALWLATILTAGATFYQAKYAKEAVQASIQSGHLDERAWIAFKPIQMLTPFDVGVKPVFNVQLINTGRTVANNTRVERFVFASQAPTSSPALEEQYKQLQALNQAHPSRYFSASPVGVPLFPTVPLDFHANSWHEIAQGDIDALSQAESTWHLFVMGTVLYKDIFDDKEHTTKFCFYLDIKDRTFYPCEVYNSAD